MKSLVIGLGSMGKRRIRCLRALGISEILGYDIRQDRKEEASQKYSIELINDYNAIDFREVDLIIISTPPDKHLCYAADAISNKIPCFIEAGVSLEDVTQTIDLVTKDHSFVAPSCTLKFHPAIKIIKGIVKSREYGLVTNFTYHCGQYLPDWHPWENINDFYVSKRETGGAREIVPFELTWLIDIFGFPQSVKGFFSETMKLDARIEDTYSFTLKYQKFLGSIIIDIVSRFATRNLLLNFEKAQLRWNWEDNLIRIYNVAIDEWETVQVSKGEAEKGYNSNINEDMYIQEIGAFIDGIKNTGSFPNILEDDRDVLKILKQIEDSDGGFNRGLQ